ncbi:MAG: hypothetical protein HC919_07435 [Oscillatoriales cyanobacterium SM2_2_1]|nr:hypothetical protein [Oscillatoriales cyanobacterium SM2_2_1]
MVIKTSSAPATSASRSEPSSPSVLPSGLSRAEWMVALSVPLLPAVMALAYTMLTNPLSLDWLWPSDAPVVSSSLWNSPKTLAEVVLDLQSRDLVLGERLTIPSGEQLYTIRQLRGRRSPRFGSINPCAIAG